MHIEKTPIEGLLIIHTQIFTDARGHFYESFNERLFAEVGIDCKFVQDNQSFSQKNILRGLHFQKTPHAQHKIVRVVHGAVLDVVVDIRSNSSTYGQHFSILLNAENKTMFYIPEGFAHGFLALKNNTVFSYKCAGYYEQTAEETLLWNDPQLNIDWGITSPLLSTKDSNGKTFQQVDGLL